MAAADPILLSSSPAFDRSLLESSKENVAIPPLLKAKGKSVKTSPLANRASLITGNITKPYTPSTTGTTTTTFRTPVKFSPPSSRAIINIDAANERPDHGPLRDPLADRVDRPAKRARASPKKTKQTKSSRTVTRTVLDRYEQTVEIAEEDIPLTDLEPAAAASEPKKEKKAKATKPRKKPVKPIKPPPPKLLEPELANRKIERQDVFFGTSSQLKRPEPLGEVRELQQALSASEAHDEAEIRSGLGFVPAQRSKQAGSRSLWSAGARGDEDYLLESDVAKTAKSQPATDKVETSFVDVDALLDTSSNSRRSTLLSASFVGKGPSVLEARHQLDPDAARVTPVKRPRGRPRNSDSTAPSMREAVPPKPLPTDTRTEAAAAVLPTSEYVRVDDIEDSEPDQVSTPRRRRGSPPKIGQLELSPSQEVPRPQGSPVRKKKRRSKRVPTDEEEVRDWQQEAAILFGLITRAVKAAPASTELAKPNWYEKMLIYDPISVEELTRWLNGGPLDAAAEQQDPSAELRWQGEVEAWKVKKWCEHHSVCCYSQG